MISSELVVGVKYEITEVVVLIRKNLVVNALGAIAGVGLSGKT
jgi:hypothetical protein